MQCCNFGRLQRDLTAFVVSRIIFTGAGTVSAPDDPIPFRLSEKAGSIGCISGISEYKRPIFTLGNLLKPCLLFHRIFSDLWSDRQRLQVALSDSNLCEKSEYLRAGTTWLVIEMLEARGMKNVPRLKSPVKALHAINEDPSLKAIVQLRDGSKVTALEIQQRYLQACEQFVSQLEDVPEEVHEILKQWRYVLTQLAYKPDSLLGELDWVTKRFLLSQVAADADYPVRKKVDLKYHELSEEGYFHKLAEAGVHRPVLEKEEIERAMRLPPGGTPATTRARLIREFSGPGITVGWTRLSNGRKIRG